MLLSRVLLTRHCAQTHQHHQSLQHQTCPRPQNRRVPHRRPHLKLSLIWIKPLLSRGLHLNIQSDMETLWRGILILCASQATWPFTVLNKPIIHQNAKCLRIYYNTQSKQLLYTQSSVCFSLLSGLCEHLTVQFSISRVPPSASGLSTAMTTWKLKRLTCELHSKRKQTSWISGSFK